MLWPFQYELHNDLQLIYDTVFNNILRSPFTNILLIVPFEIYNSDTISLWDKCLQLLSGVVVKFTTASFTGVVDPETLHLLATGEPLLLRF